MDNGDFVKDIEVNDLRNRYTLTKGSTQKTVNIRICVSLGSGRWQMFFFFVVLT